MNENQVKENEKAAEKEELKRNTQNNAANFDAALEMAKNVHPVVNALHKINKFSGGKLSKIAGKQEALKARRNPLVGKMAQKASNKIAESGLANKAAQGASKNLSKSPNAAAKSNQSTDEKATAISGIGKAMGNKTISLAIVGAIGLISLFMVSIFVTIFGGEDLIDDSGGGTSQKNPSYSDPLQPGTFVAENVALTQVPKSAKYNEVSPEKGIFGAFPYYDSNPNSTADRWTLKMDPKWKKENLVSIKKTCTNGFSMKWTVHKLAKSTFETVMEKVCVITTVGIDGIIYDPSQIDFSGPLAIRFVSNKKAISLHSWGIALDVNPGVTLTVNGRKFKKPYGRTLETYEKFIAELGSEDDPRNVNYILWIKIFQPLGFKWGGNWERDGSKTKYDGMHFEIDWRQTK